jgi:5-formyltetrahydrofolate cyclo-ligase
MTDPERSALRRAMATRRAALDPIARIAAADALVEQLEALAEWHTDQHIAGYWATAGEVLLHRASAACTRRGANWLLPRIDGRMLRFAAWRLGEPIETNRFGIPEPQVALADCLAPEAVELVLLPLLAFDRQGNRLGTGGGYYDRSFAFLRAGERPREPLLVGIGYAWQEVEALPAEAWDVRLDFICTDRELIECAPTAAA